MTRKNKARHGLARSYRIKPTVKILRAAIVASALAAAATVCAAPLPFYNFGLEVYDGNSDVEINNTNSYSVGASFEAVGIVGVASNGDVLIENSGLLNVYADGYYGPSGAYGIRSYARNDSYVSNSAGMSIWAHTSDGGFNNARATAIDSFSQDGDSTVINSGIITIDVESTDRGYVQGIYSNGRYGNSDVQNSGDISINIDTGGSAYANGIDDQGWISSTVNNTGDISITATAGGLAIVDAISIFNRYGFIDIYNSGAISIATNSDDAASTRGVDVYTADANVEIANLGDVTINSISDEASVATAIYVNARFSETIIENSGDLLISAHALSNYGRAFATGISFMGYGASIDNSGDISLLAESENGYGIAVGISANFVRDPIVINNSGDIDIELSGDNPDYFYSNSLAIGISVYDSPISLIENSGDIEITANTISGNAYAYGISVDGSRTDLQNSGLISIEAASSNDLAHAAGIAIDTTFDIAIDNSGDIIVAAESESGVAEAFGISAYSQAGVINLINSGDISITSESGVASAVSINAYYGVSIVNTGDIQAIGGNSIAISSNGMFANFGTDIVNEGNIHGGIQTGAGDDMLHNEASGSIFLSDSTIDLGDGENAFINLGELFANGDANLIIIGSGNLFTNNGNSIHMDDGAADDSLTIVGDFNGTGGVFVDVDGANLTSDSLLIDGNVLAGTANTVSINFVTPVDFSDIANGAEITIISVTGNSAASNFVLNPAAGGANGLYTFDYSLNYNQGDYSLAFDIGMSGLGTLATTLSPALQSIWYNSMGTVYQREGSARSFLGQGEDSGGGVWTRIYGADGSYVPDATKNNFGGSTTANFDMSGIGLDAGVGYAFNQQFVVGAILGTSDTDVTPEAGGEATVSATSVGAYVSYLPGNGFYGDLYYRWMDFDGDGTFGADRIDYQGKAYGFSFEFGYAFDTASGFRIEPQLQYSDMKVDLDDISYNSTAFVLNDGDSSQLRAGLALSKDYKADWGKWTPYGALSYVDISGGSNDYDISGVLEGSVDMSGSSGLLEVGVTADIGDWILAGGFNWQDGGAFDSVFSGQLNVKYTW